MHITRYFHASLLTPSLALASPSPRACNNSPSLCSTPYDLITHLGAHNSPFLRDASTRFSTFGNQFYNTTTQLDAGVRLLTVQIHSIVDAATQKTQLRLCHTTCMFIDAGTLRDWLYTIRVWLDANPNDVVTLLLVNMSFVPSTDIAAAYAAADIAHYGFVPRSPTGPPPHNTWPSLSDMISRGERLVTFVNELKTEPGGRVPYLLREFDFVWENAYDVASSTDFSCTPDPKRGPGMNPLTISAARESGRMFFMNHILYEHQAFGIILPSVGMIEETNSWYAQGGLGPHLEKCGREVGRMPTFVLVDYFNVGPAVQAVDVVNGVWEPVGRVELPMKMVAERLMSGARGGGSGRIGWLGLGVVCVLILVNVIA